MSPEDVIKRLGHPNPDEAPAWVKALAELTSDARGHAEALRGREPQAYTALDEDWLAMAKKVVLAALLAEDAKDAVERPMHLIKRMDLRLQMGFNVFEIEGHVWVNIGSHRRDLAAADQFVALGVWDRLVTDDMGPLYRPLRSTIENNTKQEDGR